MTDFERRKFLRLIEKHINLELERQAVWIVL